MWWVVWSQETVVLEVEDNALHFVRALQIYHTDQGGKYLKKISVADCVIHFARNVLPGCAMLGSVHYMGVLDVVRAGPGIINMLSDLRRISWS